MSPHSRGAKRFAANPDAGPPAGCETEMDGNLAEAGGLQYQDGNIRSGPEAQSRHER